MRRFRHLLLALPIGLLLLFGLAFFIFVRVTSLTDPGSVLVEDLLIKLVRQFLSSSDGTHAGGSTLGAKQLWLHTSASVMQFCCSFSFSLLSEVHVLDGLLVDQRERRCILGAWRSNVCLLDSSAILLHSRLSPEHARVADLPLVPGLLVLLALNSSSLLL